ncbi:MAG: glycosyltransferase family protein [Ferruginibacter sp.]
MIAIISQARINSSRLPNKIFLEAGGKPFLWYHVERLKKTGLPIIIATTDDGSEKPIVSFCEQQNVLYFRGNEKNVLKRFYDCAEKYNIGTIIRVTSDCPLIDGKIISNAVANYKQQTPNTYYSNGLERTYPRGMDYEIFSFDMLKTAYENATDEGDKEHVTPYIWKNRQGSFILKHDINKENNSNYRITLDTAEDLLLIRKLIEEYNAAELNCKGIIKVLKDNPALVEINRHIEQKKV